MARGKIYQPEHGHFVYATLNPQAGTEQAGRCPALVVSDTAANIGTGVAFVVPITNQVKGGPLEVPVPAGCRITGVALPEHLKSVDWMARNVEFAGEAPADFVEDVLAKLAALLRL